MKITGFYTDGGKRILAQSQIDGTKYSINRIVAGGGDTPLSARALTSIKQELNIGDVYTEDNISVIPAVLVAASATASYSFKEIGVYGALPGDTAELLRVYKLSEPVSIDNTSTHTINLYLKDIDVSDDKGVVIVSPDGILTESKLYKIAADMAVSTNQSEEISCTWTTLQAVLDRIQSPVKKHYTIKITDETGNLPVNIVGKMGGGSITIDAMKDTGAGFEKNRICNGYVRIDGCSLSYVTLKNISFTGSGYYQNAKVNVLNNTGKIILEKCTIQSGTTLNWALRANNNVDFYLNAVFFKTSAKYMEIKNCKLFQILAASAAGMLTSGDLLLQTVSAANEVVIEKCLVCAYNYNYHMGAGSKVKDVINFNQSFNDIVYIRTYSEAVVK